MSRTLVCYKVKPEQAAHNEELQRTAPAGLRYATFVLEDGVSFVHVASVETEDGHNPLSDVAAFRTFQEGISDAAHAELAEPVRPSAVVLAGGQEDAGLGGAKLAGPSRLRSNGGRGGLPLRLRA